MKSILRRASLLALLVVTVGCDQDPVTPQPQPPPGPPRSEAELVQALNTAYNSMDLAAFTNLFPIADEANYLFILNEPDPDNGSTSWGRNVELRVHQRMFRPQDTPSGEDPVPPDLELTEVALNLTQATDFEVRPEFLQPTGDLDPAHWRVTDAEYHAVLYFGLRGTTDYSIDARANFVIINDLGKAVGEDRKFLIYRWEDLGNFMKASEQESWSAVKQIYN